MHAPTRTTQTHQIKSNKIDSDIKYEIKRILQQIGFKTSTKIGDTLQGSIWRISKLNTNTKQNETAILKVSNRDLHIQSCGKVNGQTYKVHENILFEKIILQYLSKQDNYSDKIIKYHYGFKTKTNYYLLLQDGGNCLFDFACKAHQFINKGILDIEHWKQVTKIIFKQMVECIDYIHNKNVIHFDISLENFLISDVNVEVDLNDPRKKIRFLTNEIKIKICDFGLAKIYSSNDFSSNKWCGKTGYQSPEVICKQIFDSKKNDIWCLGICLFLLSIGTGPWHKAYKKNKTFNYVMNNSIADLLKYWKLNELYDDDLVNLMDGMIQFERSRVNLKGIKRYINQYMN